MNIKSCEMKEKSEYQIIVEVTPEEFDSAIGKAFVKARKSIFVPGFRKGKASRKIVEGMYGATVFHPDALEILLPDVVEFVEKETTDIKTFGHPQVADVDIREDKRGVDITLMRAAYPEVKLGEYKGLCAVKPISDVPESEIDAEIETMRNRNARMEKAERPAIQGDITVIDFDGYVDGEQFEGGKGEAFELELGSKAFIPGFEDQVIGMNPGDERDINLVFPEDYTPELAGKPVVFKVKLNEIKEKLLPELDDEFAKDVSEFDTLEEYKADIRGKHISAKQAESDAQFESALLDKVIENMEVEVPNAMIEEQMDISMNNFVRQVQSYGMDPAQYLQMTGMTPDSFRESTREASEKNVKINLALEKIAEVEAVEVSDEEIENEYKEASERFGMEIEKIKESVSKDRIAQDIKSRHAVKIVTDTAKAESPPNDEPKTELQEAKTEKKNKSKTTPKIKIADEKEEPAADAKKTKVKKSSVKKVEDTVVAETSSEEKIAKKAEKAKVELTAESETTTKTKSKKDKVKIKDGDKVKDKVKIKDKDGVKDKVKLKGKDKK